MHLCIIGSIPKSFQLHICNKSAMICLSAYVKACTNTLVGLNCPDKMKDLDIGLKSLDDSLLSGQSSRKIEIDNIMHNKRVMPRVNDLSAYVAIKAGQLTNLTVSGQFKVKLNQCEVNAGRQLWSLTLQFLIVNDANSAITPFI